MNDLAALARLIENLIRLGTVAEVQVSPPRVKVKTGDITTTWLPWLTPRAGEDCAWNPPTVGEQVVLISPSGQLANGVVLAGLFSEQHPTNGDREALHRMTYRDGAVIEYDSKAHHLNATLPGGGTTTLISMGGITINGPITHTGDYTHTGNYAQVGNQNVTGQVDVTVDVVAAGVSLVKHLTTGVMPGPGLSGPPI